MEQRSDCPPTRGAGALSQTEFRQTLGCFATGITVITAIDETGRPYGFSCQSFSSLSLDPPLISFNPSNTSTTWPAIRRAGSFCANVLSHEQQEICQVFSVSGADKFLGVDWYAGTATGSPIIRDVLAWLECRIEAEHEAGDHFIVVGRVLNLAVERPSAPPLLFFQSEYGTVRRPCL